MNKSLPLILMAILAGCGAKKNTHNPVDIDIYTSNRINSIIETQVKTADQSNTGEIIAKVSAEFLGTPYKANMLIGSSTEPEKTSNRFQRVRLLYLSGLCRIFA